MPFIKLSASQYPVGEWMGGNTIEIIKFPIETSFQAKNFDLRISKAQLYKKQSTFTYLPNFERQLVSLTGGVRLTHEEPSGLRTLDMHVFDTDHFSGEVPTNSYGSGSDYNLIYQSFLTPNLQLLDSQERLHVSLTNQKLLVVYSNLALSDIDILPPNDYLQETIALSKDDALLFWNEPDLDLVFHRASLDDPQQKVAITCQVDLGHDPSGFQNFLAHYRQFDTYDN